MTVNLTSNFSALDFNASTGYTPPDTNGAVGPSKYVETVNQTVGLYNAAAGTQIASTPLDTFLFSTGGLPRADGTSGLSDPIVTYDEKIGRFIVGDQDVDFNTHVSNFDIAVSKTNNPTTLTKSDWNFYSITTTEAGFDADYPGNFGYNQDAFVFTLNMFPVTSPAGHTQIVSVSNADLAAGVATPATFHNDLNDFSVRPTVMHDAVAGGPMWLVTEHGDDASIDVIKMTNVLSSTATFAYTNLAVAPYAVANNPRNPNGTIITNNMDSRILKSAEMNNTIVAAHTVAVSGSEDDVQWYDINVSGATPVLTMQGRIGSGPNTDSFFPSIDINAAGQIGVTYMKSGSDRPTDFMSMYDTGRLPSDPAGTMETPVLVPSGTGKSNYSDFSGGGRAGDLSGISLDPNNGTFWTANEFANTEAEADWGTAISNFRVINPLPATDMAVAVSGPSSVDVSNGALTETYTIVVENNGPVVAQNVVLSDSLPTGSVYVSTVKTQGTDPFTITQSGGTVTATATANIPVGFVDTFVVTVTAPITLVNGAAFSNTATVSADNPDPVPANNTSTAVGVVVNSHTPAGIVALLTGPATGNEGDTVTYNITVTNNGPGTANNTLIADTLNPHLSFRGAVTSQGTVSVAYGVITINVGSLPAGGTVTASVTAQAINQGSLANNVTVTSSNPNPNPAAASASVVTFFTDPPIVVSLPLTTSTRIITGAVVATFTHANQVLSAASFVASINWGDGYSTVGTIALTPNFYTVTGSHTYKTSGLHTITTTVKEVGNSANPVNLGVVYNKNTDDTPGAGPLNQRDLVRLPSKIPKNASHLDSVSKVTTKKATPKATVSKATPKATVSKAKVSKESVKKATVSKESVKKAAEPVVIKPAAAKHATAKHATAKPAAVKHVAVKHPKG